MLIEAFFFPYYYYIFTHLSIKTPQLNHFGSTVEKRRKLVVDCFDALDKASPPNISSGYNCTDAQRYCQRVILTEYLFNKLYARVFIKLINLK